MADAYLLVKNSPHLSGTVHVSGAKNSALKLMAASLLIDGVTCLENVPDISDVHLMEQVLQALGVVVTRTDAHTVQLDARNLGKPIAPYELVARMRASTAVLGPLAARMGQAAVALPGGCNIGSRKIDMHIAGLTALGADCRIEHGYIKVRAHQGLTAADVTLEFPSVGATENLIMAAARARGTTRIYNVAREPEICDLVDFLQAAGVSIEGRGGPDLVVHGTDTLHPVTHRVIGDRIEAGTFLIAGALCAGPVTVTGFVPSDLGIVLDKLRSAGAQLDITDAAVTVTGTVPIQPVDVQTLPFPGFPTDMQAQFMAYMALADGNSIISENVFENRFMFADEIGRMGADIRIEGNHALVKGISRLSAAPVMCPDLRGGAALVLAALVADGETRISDIHHIDRGYEDLCGKLRALGADIQRH
ncbi:MAG: UDP-N-acetylglucosamine 1-carboxyvinyltransferase [Actinomycetes bacterium]|jgi:UDP-N-acetylglucosamine 1-carboxyvinyltransferase|nr:UDP-N-acetylglucosamine 1-carboxyvinyltransferase [Actinomycetes bacterium]